MFRQLLISTAISSLLISTPLLAQSTSSGDNPQTTGQQSSQANDAGGQASTSGGSSDGMSGKGQDFDEMDENKDGKLDEDELNRFGATAAGGSDAQGDEDQGERMLKMYDHNDDGSVSKEEMEKGSRSMDNRMD